MAEPRTVCGRHAELGNVALLSYHFPDYTVSGLDKAWLVQRPGGAWSLSPEAIAKLTVHWRGNDGQPLWDSRTWPVRPGEAPAEPVKADVHDDLSRCIREARRAIPDMFRTADLPDSVTRLHRAYEATLAANERLLDENAKLKEKIAQWKTAASATFGYEETPVSVEQKMSRISKELFTLRGEIDAKSSEISRLEYKLQEREQDVTKLKAELAAKPEPVADENIRDAIEEMDDHLGRRAAPDRHRVIFWQDTLQATAAKLDQATERIDWLTDQLKASDGCLLEKAEELKTAQARIKELEAWNECDDVRDELSRWKAAGDDWVIETPDDLVRKLERMTRANGDLRVDVARLRESAAEDRREREKLGADMGMVEGESLGIACWRVKAERDAAIEQLDREKPSTFVGVDRTKHDAPTPAQAYLGDREPVTGYLLRAAEAELVMQRKQVAELEEKLDEAMRCKSPSMGAKMHGRAEARREEAARLTDMALSAWTRGSMIKPDDLRDHATSMTIQASADEEYARSLDKLGNDEPVGREPIADRGGHLWSPDGRYLFRSGIAINTVEGE